MDDAALVGAVRAGDREAFGLLVDRHGQAIHALCRRMTDSACDAEQLAHDAFVEAYLKLAQLREAAKFGPWVRQVAMNVCRQWHRRRRRGPAELTDDPPAPTTGDIDRQDVLARLSRGLGGLSAAHRLVLALHYLEGLSYEEAAAFLDVPVGTVMSRLHRARRALRTRMDNAPDVEEPPMPHDEQFRKEVDAEIALLLELAGEKAGPAERLAVILRRSPQRLVELLGRADDDATAGNLALLLPRLGAAAVQVVVDGCLAADPKTAGRARAMIRRIMAGAGFLPRHMPDRGPYLVLDCLIRSRADANVRVSLLLDWLGECEDGVALLVTNVLLCYPQAAVAPLLERFAALSKPEQLYASPDVLYALCRTGRPFCRTLPPLLRGGEVGRRAVALAAAESVGRCLAQYRQAKPWLDDATPRQYANEVRCRRKWPPLRAEDVGEDLLLELAAAVAEIAGRQEAVLREGAVRALGCLRAREHVACVRNALGDDDPPTRMAAIVALAEIGDVSAGPALIEAARGANAAERRAAVEAIGRLKTAEARPLLLRLIDDADPQVQEAAVVALGQVCGADAPGLLEPLLATGPKNRRKAAGKALTKFRKHAAAPAESRTPMWRKIRGDQRLVTHDSLGAAIRYALPELRPYGEREITRRLAGTCGDHSAVRRGLVDYGLMRRAGGVYELTAFGEAAWRVEHYVMQRYLRMPSAEC